MDETPSFVIKCHREGIYVEKLFGKTIRTIKISGANIIETIPIASMSSPIERDLYFSNYFTRIVNVEAILKITRKFSNEIIPKFPVAIGMVWVK